MIVRAIHLVNINYFPISSTFQKVFLLDFWKKETMVYGIIFSLVRINMSWWDFTEFPVITLNYWFHKCTKPHKIFLTNSLFSFIGVRSRIWSPTESPSILWSYLLVSNDADQHHCHPKSNAIFTFSKQCFPLSDNWFRFSSNSSYFLSLLTVLPTSVSVQPFFPLQYQFNRSSHFSISSTVLPTSVSVQPFFPLQYQFNVQGHVSLCEKLRAISLAAELILSAVRFCLKSNILNFS